MSKRQRPDAAIIPMAQNLMVEAARDGRLPPKPAYRGPEDTAYHIQAYLDTGGAMVQLVNTKTKAVLSPTFEVKAKQLAALRKTARVIE